MNQKKIIQHNKTRKTAVYFDGDERISTMVDISYTEACLMLEDQMHRKGASVSMLLFNAGVIPLMETSWKRQDYEKYIKRYQKCKECHGFGLVDDDGYCRVCAECRKERGEA